MRTGTAITRTATLTGRCPPPTGTPRRTRRSRASTGVSATSVSTRCCARWWWAWWTASSPARPSEARSAAEPAQFSTLEPPNAYDVAREGEYLRVSRDHRCTRHAGRRDGERVGIGKRVAGLDTRRRKHERLLHRHQLDG